MIVSFTLELTELLPGIMNQLGPDNINHLKKIADNMSANSNISSSGGHAGEDTNDDDDDDDDVPDLVANFEDISKM